MSVTAQTHILAAPRVLNAYAMEQCLSELADEDLDNECVIIDLSNCIFIEVVALVLTISLLSTRIRDSRPTQLRLPKSKNVRDYLRSWHFPEAIKDATQYSFVSFVHQEDRHYFGENIDLRSQSYAGKVFPVQADSGYSRLLSDRFFGFSVFTNRDSEFRPKLAIEVASQWKKKVITSVLKKMLRGPEEIFASRIIFEALLNSIRHPSASKIILVSHCDESGPISYLTVCIWDDGVGIEKTLNAAIANKSNITSIENDDDIFGLKYDVKSKDGSQIFTTSFVPTEDTSGEHLFFSSLLPGISSAIDTSELGTAESPDSEVNADPILSMPGMGLFLLVNAVVDIYGGSVAIRSENYFLNAKKHDDPQRADYAVKIKKSNAFVLGNLLTIRLPLKSQG